MAESPRHVSGSAGAPARDAERVGKTLAGKWTLDRLIGVGGMASVYAASHRNGALAAIKILNAEFARQPEARSRFMREGYIANSAGPGAVRVLDDDVDDDGAPFLVMDLLTGEAVDERVARMGGRLTVLEGLWVAAETLATLEIAHANGIIHRDLKPGNLFWTTDDSLKVLDFGIARLQRSTRERTMAGTVMGTLGFMAHEQALGTSADIDARTDIWAVGAILFHLLTGRDVHPPGEINELVVAATQHAPSVTTVDPTLPKEVAAIVDRALQFEQADRYPTAKAMREAILGVASVAELRAAIRSPRSPPARPAPRASAETASPDAPPPAPAPARPEEGDDVASTGLATGMSDDDTLALRALLELLELALLTRAELEGRPQQRSLDVAHLGSFRRLEMAYQYAVSALATAHIGLFWNVLPEGFATRQGLLWVARPPLLPTPKMMFDGGVRMLGLLPGLTLEEFGELVRLLRGDLAPFTDYATFLQSSLMPHLVYRIDPTQPGMPEHPSISIDSTIAGHTNVLAMLEALSEGDPALRAVILTRLARLGVGYEKAIGSLLPTAGVELSMSLLRVLDALGTEGARDVMRVASESPVAVVRLGALSLLDPGGDQLRAALDAALASSDSPSRIELLLAIEAYKITAAAPVLVQRVKSGSFDMLPAAERRQAFSTLSALLPLRAETIAIGLLRDQRVISTDAHETTREIACEALGRVGSSRDTREALEAAVKSRSKTSERVWLAAKAALSSVEARAGGLK